MIDIPPTHTNRGRQLDTQSTNKRVQEPANSGMEAGVRADIRQAGEGGSVGEDEKSCMNCDKFECSEMGPCVRWAYAPGSDEIESKENAMSPAPKSTAWTDGLERC